MFQQNILLIFAFFLILSPYNSLQQQLRVQPELDTLVKDLDKYLKNERFFNLQVKCIIQDGPCDAVGRWMKPRVPSALLGECLACTEKQKEGMVRIITYIQDEKPDIYRAAIAKYVQKAGIEIPK